MGEPFESKCINCGHISIVQFPAPRAPLDVRRLLAIEAAARAYVDLLDMMNYPDTAAMYPAALRAALEEPTP